MTKAQKLSLIWRHTHRDFRSNFNGERTILVLRAGGTTSVPLVLLTDAEIEAKLPYGQHKERGAA